MTGPCQCTLLQGKVTCVGQVIGVVVGATEEQARAGAKAVLVEYRDLPAVLDIDDAIAAGSYFQVRACRSTS